MKKLASVLLCVILALSLCLGTVSAAEHDYLEATAAVNAEAGTVELVLKAAQPMTNTMVTVRYDSEKLECGPEDVTVSGTVPSHYADEPGTVRFGTAVSTANTIAAGETVATIRFAFEGGWVDTTVTVTVENWNTAIGVNAAQEVRVSSSRFVDVPADEWYAEAVNRMAADGRINGIDQTHYGPALPMNRASFVTLLGRLDGNADTNAETCFVDVPVDSFYSGHVAWALEKEITNGSDATHFNPTGEISRAQMVTFLYRYAKSEGMDVTVKDLEQTLGAFSDAQDVLDIDWAAEPFAWAIENGIINGMEGTLNPYGISNRAQVAVMLYRFFYSE